MSEHLLEEAERIYRALGTIPFDTAVRLMDAGYIVEELERQWSKQRSEATS